MYAEKRVYTIASIAPKGSGMLRASMCKLATLKVAKLCDPKLAGVSSHTKPLLWLAHVQNARHHCIVSHCDLIDMILMNDSVAKVISYR